MSGVSLTRLVVLGVPLTLAACIGPLARERHAPELPPTIRYVPRSAWGARAPVLPMRTPPPTRLTIHHTATAVTPARTLEARLTALQQFSRRDDSLADGRRKPAWADVPYHYYLSVDGSVGEGREWRYVGDSDTPYDLTGHLLVVVEGDFERDTLTTAQRTTLAELVPALARRFRIPASALGAHRDYARTTCPGEHLYVELPKFRALVAAVEP
jgi:hypothetical protein